MSPRTERRSTRRFDIEGLGVGALVVAVGAYRFGGTIVDHDLWGRVRFGLDRVTAGRFLYEDHYSYLTAGQTMYDHDWLTANTMARVYDTFGPSGLVIVKAFLALGVVGLLAWWLIRSGLKPVRMAMVMSLAIVALTPTLLTFRPQVLTTVLFTVTLLVIVLVQEGHRRLVWAVPFIFLLWVNLHGGFLAGVAVVGLWAGIYLLTETGGFRWAPLAAWGIGAACLGINPLGYDLVRFLLATTTVDRPEILDWLPINLASPQGLAYAILAVGMAFVLWSRRKAIIWPIWIPLVGVVVAPLVATRHLQLFVPAVVILGGWIWSRHQRVFKSDDSVTIDGVAALVWITLLFLSTAFTFVWVGYRSKCLAVDAEQAAFPARAVSAIPAGTPGNAVVPFNWGEYVIWWRGTELQVSTDGRRETAYSEAVHQMNLDFVNAAGEEWDRLLSAAPTDLVLLPTGAPGAQMMVSYPGWRLEYRDRYASIFLPQGSEINLEIDEPVPIDSAGVCFPAGTPPVD